MIYSEKSVVAKSDWIFVLLRVYHASIFSALFYSLAAFILGWSFGGPDILGNAGIFSPLCTPIKSSRILLGLASYVFFILALFVLFQFSPRADAWLTRLTQRAGIIVGSVALIVSWLLILIVFVAGSTVLGCTLFLRDLLTIVSVGMLGGGFLQCMAAAFQPNPNSKQEKRLLDYQQKIVRQKAEELGLDPDEAAESAGQISSIIRRDIGSIVGKAHGFVVAVVGGGFHGGLLFVLGATFFVGLGFGVGGSAVLLFYVIPLLVALADTLTIMSFQLFVRFFEDRKKQAWSAAVSLPVAILGMVYKSILVVVGAAALSAFGGPDVPWPLYWEAAKTEPFGQGLTVSVILLMSLLWPLLLLIGPISHEFEH